MNMKPFANHKLNFSVKSFLLLLGAVIFTCNTLKATERQDETQRNEVKKSPEVIKITLNKRKKSSTSPKVNHFKSEEENNLNLTNSHAKTNSDHRMETSSLTQGTQNLSPRQPKHPFKEDMAPKSIIQSPISSRILANSDELPTIDEESEESDLID